MFNCLFFCSLTQIGKSWVHPPEALLRGQVLYNVKVSWFLYCSDFDLFVCICYLCLNSEQVMCAVLCHSTFFLCCRTYDSLVSYSWNIYYTAQRYWHCLYILDKSQDLFVFHKTFLLLESLSVPGCLGLLVIDWSATGLIAPKLCQVLLWVTCWL